MQRINIVSPQFEYDEEDPEGFRSGMAGLGKLFVKAEESGATVYELPPGQAICPYHYECGEEEWLLVLAGNPNLRHPEGPRASSPGISSSSLRARRAPTASATRPRRLPASSCSPPSSFPLPRSTRTATRSGSGPATPRRTSSSTAGTRSTTSTARSESWQRQSTASSTPPVQA